jgi:hypothetical protein
MEKAWMLSGCLILVVSAFSQVLQVATKAVPAVVYSQPLRQPERPTGFRYASTYSKPHAALAGVVDENSRHIVLINTLWGSIALYTTTAKIEKERLPLPLLLSWNPIP